MTKHRKMIAFDFDTKSLDIYYPNNIPRAYDDLRKEFEVLGFEHRQGSVYISQKALDEFTLTSRINKLCEKLPWLSDCTNTIDVANVGKAHSLLGQLEDACRENEDKKQEWIEDLIKQAAKTTVIFPVHPAFVDDLKERLKTDDITNKDYFKNGETSLLIRKNDLDIVRKHYGDILSKELHAPDKILQYENSER